MTGWLIRIAIFAGIGALIWFGVRRILGDWQRGFRAVDADRRKRDLAERGRADVITLERDKDGTYRPSDDRDRR